MILNKIKDWLKQKDARVFLSALAASLFVFILAQYLQIGVVFFIAALSLLLLLVWSVAGIIVFKSLFVVAANLTFILFIAQSYCTLPDSSRVADDALKGLLGFGILYVAFAFIRSLYDDFDKSLGHLEKTYEGGKPWTIVVLLGLFIGLFVWQVYQVVSPIVLNLCIY